MTWKAGDTVSLPVYLLAANGSPKLYANWAAFLADGWALTFYRTATALASQPTVTLLPVGAAGCHTVTFILPQGVDHILITPPGTARSDPADILLVVGNTDNDSLASSIAAVTGRPTVPVGAQAFNFTIIEGDNFLPVEFTIQSTQLQFLDTGSSSIVGYNDLSDIGGFPWTVVASARGSWNELPASAVNFSFDVVITSKTLNKVAVSFAGSVPAGAKVVNADGTTDTTGFTPQTNYLYDIQLQPPAGSTYAGRKLTPIVGVVTIKRQQTTTP